MAAGIAVLIGLAALATQAWWLALFIGIALALLWKDS